MQRFRIGETWILADSAREALRTNTARQAPLGAELVSGELFAFGRVLARKDRHYLDDGYTETWVATAAWPDVEPPIDLARALGIEEA